jgi:hypothetical protein
VRVDEDQARAAVVAAEKVDSGRHWRAIYKAESGLISVGC